MVEPRVTGLHIRYIIEHWFAQPKIDLNNDRIWVRLESELRKQGLILPVEAIKHLWTEDIDPSLGKICRVTVKDKAAFGWKKEQSEEEQMNCLSTRLHVIRNLRRNFYGSSNLLQEWDPCEDEFPVPNEPFSAHCIRKLPTLFASRQPGAISLDVPGFKLPTQIFLGYEFLVLRDDGDLLDWVSATQLEYLVRIHGGLVRSNLSEIQKCGLIFACECPMNNLEAFCKVEGKIYRREALYTLLGQKRRNHTVEEWSPADFDKFCWKPDLKTIVGNEKENDQFGQSSSRTECEKDFNRGECKPTAKQNYLNYELGRLRSKMESDGDLERRLSHTLIKTAMETNFLLSPDTLLSVTVQKYNQAYSGEKIDKNVVRVLFAQKNDWNQALELVRAKYATESAQYNHMLLLVNHFKGEK